MYVWTNLLGMFICFKICTCLITKITVLNIWVGHDFFSHSHKMIAETETETETQTETQTMHTSNTVNTKSTQSQKPLVKGKNICANCNLCTYVNLCVHLWEKPATPVGYLMQFLRFPDILLWSPDRKVVELHAKRHRWPNDFPEDEAPNIYPIYYIFGEVTSRSQQSILACAKNMADPTTPVQLSQPIVLFSNAKFDMINCLLQHSPYYHRQQIPCYVRVGCVESYSTNAPEILPNARWFD